MPFPSGCPKAPNNRRSDPTPQEKERRQTGLGNAVPRKWKIRKKQQTARRQKECAKMDGLLRGRRPVTDRGPSRLGVEIDLDHREGHPRPAFLGVSSPDVSG